MLKTAFGFAGKVVNWFIYVVGLLVVVVVFGLWAGSKNEKETEAKFAPEKRPGRVEKSVVEKPGRAGDGGCMCFDGAVCVGPKGGKYCITHGGTKRYLTDEGQQRMQQN